MPGAIGSKANPQETESMSNVATAPEFHSLEGMKFEIVSDADRTEAIEKAVDYRGDVTLSLASGEELEAFLFNHNAKSNPPVVDVFTKGSETPRNIVASEILALTFTGKDNAFGKSWQAWVSKKKDERQEEARQLAESLKQQGYL
jgi:hypothetical protein